MAAAGKRVLLFIHGLESGVGGAKAQYLSRKFSEEMTVVIPEMSTGGFTSLNKNSFLVQGVCNLFSIFSWRWFDSVIEGVLNDGKHF
jgi:hypothetical protein